MRHKLTTCYFILSIIWLIQKPSLGSLTTQADKFCFVIIMLFNFHSNCELTIVND